MPVMTGKTPTSLIRPLPFRGISCPTPTRAEQAQEEEAGVDLEGAVVQDHQEEEDSLRTVIPLVVVL